MQRPYPLEAVSWGHFSGICLGKEDCIMNAGKHMVVLYTSILEDTSGADVIVHLGWKEARSPLER